MLDKIELSKNLANVIGSEKIEFAVKAKRSKPLKSAIGLIIFGTFWTAFSSIFVYPFLWPLFLGEEVKFSANGNPTVASPENLEPITIPAIIIGMFVLVGIGMLFGGFYILLKKGGYFVGTPLRLITFESGKIRSIDWEQFSGDIEVRGTEFEGNLTLQMRTGRMVSSKNSGSRYVPDIIYLSGIPNVFEIEKICRKRIKENDPTPPNSAEQNQILI
jgi:hypothetical protein